LSDRAPLARRWLVGTLSHYAAAGLAIDLALYLLFVWSDGPFRTSGTDSQFALACGATGLILAIAAARLRQTWGAVLAAIAIALALAVMARVAAYLGAGGRWLTYAFALSSMLALILSGIFDDSRPRVVAGWSGLGGTICV